MGVMSATVLSFIEQTINVMSPFFKKKYTSQKIWSGGPPCLQPCAQWLFGDEIFL